MRERHFPRLCRSCEAPMARQEDACWRCGAPWDDREPSPVTRHMPPRSRAAGREGTPEPFTALVTDAAILDPA